MTKITLRKYLTKMRIELYEDIEQLTNEINYSTDTEYVRNRKAELNSAQDQLNLVKEIINICENRGKY